MEKPQIGSVVWMACRAVQGCEGKNAKLIQVRKVNGSTAFRYRCQSCKRLFTIVI